MVAIVLGCSWVTACSDPAGGSEQAAGCAAPRVTVAPARVAPGGTVEVRGRYFVSGCSDTGENGHDPAPDPAATDLPVVLLTGSADSGRELARLDAAGELGVVESTVTVPADVAAGDYEVRLGDAEPVPLTVR